MNLFVRHLILAATLSGIPLGDVGSQTPEFSQATLYRCSLIEKKPLSAQRSALAPFDDHLIVDTPGVTIRPEEFCIIRQMFLELPAERRHHDTVFQYNGLHLVNNPDFLLVLTDAASRSVGALLVEQNHKSAGYQELSGAYRTLPVQHMQIELFLQLTAMHQLDK